MTIKGGARSPMNFDNLKSILEQEPSYRYRQVMAAIFQQLISDWDEASNLPLGLRQKLQQEFPLAIPAQTLFSQDKKTAKAVISLSDGLRIESVLMRHQGRNTVCVSSQVGCPIGCTFCATGKMGFRRNLTSGEIVTQVLFFNRLLKKDNERVDNVVLMGMGEPFLNYDQVMGAIGMINDDQGLNIGARKISISTVGVIEGIRKLKRDSRQFNLAISLHAPNNFLRSKIIPYNKRVPLEKVMSGVKSYALATRRKVLFEYVMIRDFNDSMRTAEELAQLLQQIPSALRHVNLIAYNPTGVFHPSSPETIKKFSETLEHRGVSVTERFRFGQGIRGACGQLAGKS